MSYIVDARNLSSAFNEFLKILPTKSLGAGTRNLSVKRMDELLKIYSSGQIPDIDKVVFSEKQYPPLPARSRKLISDMRCYLSDAGKLNRKAEKELESNALAYLLYSVLWKNGDRNKFEPIMHGLAGRDINDPKDLRKLKKVRSNGSYVFFQFGRHLQNKQQPIIDQHSIRAYNLLLEFKSRRPTLISVSMASELRAKFSASKYNKPSQESYKKYLKWIEEAVDHHKNEDHREKLLLRLDKLMYSLGKAIKATRKH